MPHSIWIGFDPKEANAFAVARHSASRLNIIPIPVFPVFLRDLQEQGYYRRPIEMRKNDKGVNCLWDPISEYWMSTEFAISRFFVPLLARHQFQFSHRNGRRAGWSLFTDVDVQFRVSPQRIFDLADSRYAVMCVQHDYRPTNETKMDGQVQSQYQRKNWSSVMLINNDHPAHEALWEQDLLNKLPGRDLHRFCWLKDSEIGSLPIAWNYLVGHYTKEDCSDPCLVHFTEGIPTVQGYENCEYAEEWKDELRLWVKNGR